MKLFKQNTNIGYTAKLNRKHSVYCNFWLWAKSGLKAEYIMSLALGEY